MVLFDGIVFSLQETGGISVLFSEIISRLPAAAYELMGFRQFPPAGSGGALKTLRPTSETQLSMVLLVRTSS